MIKIVQNGNPVLREQARDVPILDIGKPKIAKILRDMADALHGEDDGVAIAAPQIGVSLRIFLVNGRIFDEDFERGKKIPISKIIQHHPDLVFINPVFKKISRDKKLLPEGCLSVRPIYGKVRRATRATMEAYDEHGKAFTYGGAALIAQIFQHECDHLNGILFVDHATNIEEMTPEAIAEVEAKSKK